MTYQVVFSGFGGQGILFAGKVLCYAGMRCGKAVTWLPSYGPEMRGGTANVVVSLSDDDVGSPLVRYPDAVIALNGPSMLKYEPLVKQKGYLVYNQTLIDAQPQRLDITYIPVEASKIASELGPVKMTSVAALGAFIDATDLLPKHAIINALRDNLGGSRRAMLKPNEEAFHRGMLLAGSVSLLLAETLL